MADFFFLRSQGKGSKTGKGKQRFRKMLERYWMPALLNICWWSAVGGNFVWAYLLNAGRFKDATPSLGEIGHEKPQ